MASASIAPLTPESIRQVIRSEAERFVTEAVQIVMTARALVELDTITAADLLRIDRARCFELLGRYQRFKHGVIFDPVIQADDKARSATARMLKCECVMMGEAFSAYVARWQHTDVTQEWKSYRSDMVVMTEQLLEHLRVEHAAIICLLDNDRDTIGRTRITVPDNV
ncbi:MAG: hypothetical protein EOO77_09820 [Oxalobacteraceae bacterium]|nr:MAG: hypothetical protein EOO77_09820 [Oxalobacteraceae bacterium]